MLNKGRALRLIDRALNRHDLDLKGLVVLTEAASNNYIVTPIIAARAGAKEVWAITRDSSYGSASGVTQATQEFADFCGVSDRIKVVYDKKKEMIGRADIVTNLGFVRPIDATMVGMMKEEAVIPLMYAAWEFRETDLDLQACKGRGTPVMGTDESKEAANILPLCGPLCTKMVLEAGFEVAQNNIVVFSRDLFGPILRDAMRSFGAQVALVDDLRAKGALKNLADADCLIVSDYDSEEVVIGEGGQISAEELARLSPGIAIVQFTGLVDADGLKKAGLECHPPRMLARKRMSRTLADLGPMPVIGLHAAGLKVGQAMFEAKRRGLKGEEFVRYVKANSCAEQIRGTQY